MTALETLQNLFPRENGQANFAQTGLIPIELFDAMEDSLRPLMREAGLRAMYRGPRPNSPARHDVPWCVNSRPSMTRRCDAEAVLFYFQSR